MIEPELITIIEGPTPEFHPSPHIWLQSIYESPENRNIAMCQLRTNTGHDIMDRCLSAWRELRPVKLDFPDDLRMRQQVDVVSLRLENSEDGEMLRIWVSAPMNMDALLFDDEFDDEFDDDDDYDDMDDNDDVPF